MKKTRPLLLTLFILAAACMQNNKPEIQRHLQTAAMNPAAPPETEQFGRLTGRWQAEYVQRNQDGSWGDKKTKAVWDWFYILDGHAIQDNWIRYDSTGNEHVVGTNIRIYNPKENKWHMSWIDIGVRRLAVYSAVEKDGKLIMTGHESSGKMARNTFHNFTDNSFEWLKEWTNDEGKTWFEVSKIYCTREAAGENSKAVK